MTGPGRRRAAGRGRSGRRVTLKQVAADLGLSPTTVSLVLNRSPAADSIPDETHRRVFAAAEKLGYRPDFVARSLRSRRTFSVGVLVPEISDAYASGVLGGVEDRLLEEGYFYLLASHRSRGELLREQMQLLRDRLVDGFILVATPLHEPPGVPTVAIAGHNSLDQVTNVVIDHDRAATLALTHLANLGHRRIAFFKGPAHSADTETRWQAIRKAAAALGLEVRPELTLQLGGDALEERFSPQEAHEEGHAFGRKLLEVGSPFSALFAFNDVSAIGAMRAFLDAGLRVPEQISVVGFDDIHAAAFQNPSLTTVRQPLIQMGETATRILLRHLAGEVPERDTLTVEPELMLRDSTGPALHETARDLTPTPV
jgi:DNA-binding LacI/PurR family transcriptional regulator